MSTPSRRRRLTVPPLSELDAPGRTRDAGADATLWTPRPEDPATPPAADPVTAPPTPDPDDSPQPPPPTAGMPGGAVPGGAVPGGGGDGGLGGAESAEPAGRRHAAVEGEPVNGVRRRARRGAAPVEQADPVAQRIVAEERAAAARAVLAERAAAVVAGSARTRPTAAWITLGAAAVLIFVRLWLVGSGALFGAVPVRAVDAAAVLALALGLALLPTPRRVSAFAPTPGRGRRLAVVLAVPGLAGAGLILLQPAVPTSARAAACPAAPVRGAATTAVTTDGATARSGPGRAYPTTGRFPAGCAVGVAGYCLGDPLPIPGGWADSRWLLVSRQTGPAGVVARHLSGEPELPRFLPAATAAPAGPDLPLLPAADCGRDGLGAPGETYLEEVATSGDGDNLAARSPRAANVGFAVWVRPDPATGGSPLLRGEPYRQIPGGAAGPAGRATTRWDYPTLVRDLDPRRTTQTVTVAVLAIGCTAPAAPTTADTASLTTYEVVDGRLGPLSRRLRGYQAATDLPGLDLARLTAAACQPPA